MKKIFLFICILMLISVLGCQKPKEDVMEKTEAMAKTTSDPAVDAVGKDLNNVDDIDKELSTDELDDLDSTLADIDKI